MTQSNPRPSVVLLLFAGSGASALIYETVWLQLLQLVVGSSAVSMAVLLGTFMGGMCLGSLLLPRIISTRHHPLRVYASLELAIGIIGVLLLLVLPLVGRVYTAWGGYGATGFLLRGLVAAVCLVPPTLAMGATLPAVARWTEATPSGSSWLGLFYAGNIAGAVFGTLLAGFYLLRVFDMTIATLVAAAINVAVAAMAFSLSARAGKLGRAGQAGQVGQAGLVGQVGLESRPNPANPVSAVNLANRVHPVSLHVALALSGFSALAAEVIWTRELGLLFGGTVYTFSIILAVYLTGLGIGSGAGALLSRRLTRPHLALGWCQVLSVGALAWTAWMLADSLPYWPVAPSISRSISFNFQLDFARAVWAVLPAPLLWGASFPLALAARAGAADAGRAVGGLYAANTAGAICGALAAGLLLVPWIGSQHAQQIMMAASAVAAILMWAGPGSAALVAVGLSICAAGALCATVPSVPKLLIAYGRHATSWAGRSADIIYVGEGLNASVAVSRLPGGVLNYHNAGKIQASSEPHDMRLQRMLGHLTTLISPAPRSVLVIGCGAGVTAGAVSIDPLVERVTIAEIEPLVPRVVSTYFGDANHDVVRSPKTRIYVDDARHFLQTTKEMFDGITSDPLDPWVKGAATLYTKEFFEVARRHLNPGGVVTLFVQLYESSPQAVKSEAATFFEVFPDGIIWGNAADGKGYDMVLLGQADPGPIDVDAMEQRLQQPGYAPVKLSLGQVGIFSAVELLGNYAGRAPELKGWLQGAAITHDRDLRLQYLAGLGLNQQKAAGIYTDLLTYRRFPDDLFAGSPDTLWWLKSAMALGRE